MIWVLAFQHTTHVDPKLNSFTQCMREREREMHYDYVIYYNCVSMTPITLVDLWSTLDILENYGNSPHEDA